MQAAFRGVLVCRGVRKSSLPGKARGFRGQDTVERHDGLGVVRETIDQWEQENPASKGRDMIDDFRLRGSRTWRRMGGPLTRGGWRTEVAHVVAHDFDNYKSALSEGEALAVVVQAVPENLDWTGLARIARVLWGKAPCGAGIACPPLARRVVAPHGRGRWWRERPHSFCCCCGTGQGEVVHAKIHHLPSPFGGRSLHSDTWREGRNAEDLDPGCPAQPGFDCCRASSLQSRQDNALHCNRRLEYGVYYLSKKSGAVHPVQRCG